MVHNPRPVREIFFEPTSNHSSLDHPQKKFWLNLKKKIQTPGLKNYWFITIWNIWYVRFDLVNLLWGDIGISKKSQGHFIGCYRTVRQVLRDIHMKTPGLNRVPKLRYAQKSLFFRGFVRFGLVNFSSGVIELSGRSQGTSTRKPRVSIKSQSWDMPKNHYFWEVSWGLVW